MVHCIPCTILVLSLFAAVTKASSALTQNASVRLYFGSGCFFARQNLFISDFEQSVLGRADSELTAIAGYAGSLRKGRNGTACYHNQQNFSDYDSLGDAEAVEVDVPLASLESAFATYFGAFIEMEKGKWVRPDYYDQGAQYRSLLGVPGGIGNLRVLQAMRKANVHNLTLQQGQGSDADTFLTNTVYVMDSDRFTFIQAELCLQFHDDSQVKYPDSYHKLFKGFEASGKVVSTGCPANFICNSTARSAPDGVTMVIV